MKVRVKMTLCILGLLSLLFGAGGSLLISLSFHNAMEREKDMSYGAFQMTISALRLAGELDGQWNSEEAAHTLRQLFAQNSSLGTAFRLDTASGPISENGSAAACIGRAAPEAGDCLFRLAAGADGARYLILSGQASEEPLYLHVAWDVSELYAQRNAQLRAYLGSFGGMAALCGAMAYILSRFLTAPLEDLSQAARAVASGELSARVDIRSQDEIGAVARDFNAMAARLETSVEELKLEVKRKENFMGAFSHELKTPLTSIIGYADLLRGGALTGGELAEAASYIFSEGKRLERLSHKLLELLEVQRSGLPLLVTSPADLVRELLDRLRPVCREQGVELVCQCEPGTCLLEPDLIRSLLLNLLDNARKAMDQGGVISVKSEMTSEGCRLLVTDQGRGIPTQALDHLTQPFYRADKARSREQGGAGLGLALCQEIVAFHGGTLKFENRAAGGVCVTAELKGGRPCG